MKQQQQSKATIKTKNEGGLPDVVKRKEALTHTSSLQPESFSANNVQEGTSLSNQVLHPKPDLRDQISKGTKMYQRQHKKGNKKLSPQTKSPRHEPTVENGGQIKPEDQNQNQNINISISINNVKHAPVEQEEEKAGHEEAKSVKSGTQSNEIDDFDEASFPEVNVQRISKSYHRNRQALGPLLVADTQKNQYPYPSQDPFFVEEDLEFQLMNESANVSEVHANEAGRSAGDRAVNQAIFTDINSIKPLQKQSHVTHQTNSKSQQRQG